MDQAQRIFPDYPWPWHGPWQDKLTPPVLDRDAATGHYDNPSNTLPRFSLVSYRLPPFQAPWSSADWWLAHISRLALAFAPEQRHSNRVAHGQMHRLDAWLDTSRLRQMLHQTCP